jgi:hypothetical protein
VDVAAFVRYVFAGGARPDYLPATKSALKERGVVRGGFGPSLSPRRLDAARKVASDSLLGLPENDREL